MHQQTKEACLQRRAQEHNQAIQNRHDERGRNVLIGGALGAIQGGVGGVVVGAGGGEFLDPLGGGVPGAVAGGIIGSTFGAVKGIFATAAYELTIGDYFFNKGAQERYCARRSHMYEGG